MAGCEGQDYRRSHTASNYGLKYDRTLFHEGSFDSLIWAKERALLDEIVHEYGVGARLLDVATGTGRVLEYLESQFDEAVGVDISDEMLREARNRIYRAALIRCDFAEEPDRIEGKFDCITVFRFFLNAEPPLRAKMLDAVAEKLRDAEAIVVFNVHGNKYSTRFPVVLALRLLGRKPSNHMSVGEVRKLVAEHGLRIERCYGMGFVYKVFFRLMPTGLWRLVEDWASSVHALRHFGSYLLFVCRRR